GKERLPARYLLTHQAGLAAITVPIPPEKRYDWNFMTTALAAQQPLWQPGTQHGYHAITFGYLVGELVRRVDGRTLGTYFREEIAQPLGADFHIGLDVRDDARCAEMIPAPPPPPGVPNLFAAVTERPQPLTAQVFSHPLLR